MAPASKKTLHDILPTCTNSETLLIHPPAAKSDKTVFYFPGCGSERLYAEISMASVYILLKNNIRIVLPPPFLCCGFPAKVNAKKKMHGEISLRDTIILSQIRDMLGYIVFDAFVVSCGTCREALNEMGVEDIFDCKINDISRFVLEKGNAEIPTNGAGSFFYHTPCHDSME
jgi:Fe-S oxidoreductase